MKPSLEGGVNIFDILNLHPVADNPMIRFRVGDGGGETIVCEMTNNGVSFQRNVLVGTAYELRTNAIDTVNDNDLVISRDNVPVLTLDKFTEDTVEKEAIICSKQLRANAQLRVNNLQINQFPVGIEYADFRLENANNSIMRFFVGNSTTPNLQISEYIDGESQLIREIVLNRTTKCGGTFHTNNIDTLDDNSLILRRNGSIFLTLDGTDGIKASQSITVEGANDFLYTNNTGNELNIWSLDTIKFYSNATNQMEIKQTQIDFNDDIFVADGKGIRVPEIFTYNYDTYTVQGVTGDVVWVYDNTSYMFYDASDYRFAFLVGVICNFQFSGTAFNVVSDERKKDNIEDVDEDCSELVKKIKVKTFNYKDDKKKKNNIGFIAQEVQANIPHKFETAVSDSGEFLGIDYGKMTAILWGALQEEMKKREHLEARLFEMEDIVKEMRGKGKGQTKQLSQSESSLGRSPKPKAKAKTKTKNVE